MPYADLEVRKKYMAEYRKRPYALAKYKLTHGTKAVYRKHNLKRFYGISVDEYDRLFDAQNGLCAICGNRETAGSPTGSGPRNLSVDHCHWTKKVRGLLCSRCNMLIGHAKDNLLILQQAIEYLKRRS